MMKRGLGDEGNDGSGVERVAGGHSQVNSIFPWGKKMIIGSYGVV